MSMHLPERIVVMKNSKISKLSCWLHTISPYHVVFLRISKELRGCVLGRNKSKKCYIYLLKNSGEVFVQNGILQ